MCLVHGWNLVMDANILHVIRLLLSETSLCLCPFPYLGRLAWTCNPRKAHCHIGRRFFNYNHYVIICYCTDLDIILLIFVVIASSCLCVCLIHDFLMLQVFPSKNKKQETQGLFLDNCIMILKAAKYGPYLESLNNEVRLQTIFSFDWTSFLLTALHLYLYECYQCWSARSS